MGLFKPRDAVDPLEDLLDRERAVILAGQFDKLERLVAEKERLTQRLEAEGLSKRVITHLQSKAKRNGRLLQAMEAGLKEASLRISKLRDLPDELQTYDASGKKSPLHEGRKTLG